MTTSQRPRKPTGRPSKGDRHTFQVRIPRAEADRLMAYAHATEQHYSDIISRLVVDNIDQVDVEAVEYGTNRLDVEAIGLDRKTA